MKPMPTTMTLAIRPKKDRSQPLHAAQFADALLRMSTAAALSGMSESTLYRRVAADPTFPKLVKMGSRCTRIRAGDLTAWLKSKHQQAGL